MANKSSDNDATASSTTSRGNSISVSSPSKSPGRPLNVDLATKGAQESCSSANCACSTHTPHKITQHSQHVSNCKSQNCCCSPKVHLPSSMVYQHVTPAVTNVVIDTSTPTTQDSKGASKHGGVHYCSSCPPGPHTHHVYSPANCHPQQPAFMDHAHCRCQPGFVDGHFHFPHQQTQPRPVTVMAHPPPLLLRPVQPQHMQQHQAILEQELRPYFDGKWKGLGDPHLSSFGGRLQASEGSVPAGTFISEAQTAQHHPLFHHNICQWPGCEAFCETFQQFLHHLNTDHALDERSTAQARVQMQVVMHLEFQMNKERERLSAMMNHLHTPKVAQHTPNTNPELEDEEHHVPHSQAQPLLHVATAPPPHSHMPSLEDVPSAQQSPTLPSRQDVPMSPESPPPTMGSPRRKHSITPPPNITVHDITSPSDITVVATPSGHMMEEKPVHMKRRNGDPDGIALDIQRSADFYQKADVRPPFTYASLIRQAILDAPEQQLTLNEIYSWFIHKFAYFRRNAATWKNAVRHNLSLHKCFVRKENVKGAVWIVDEDEYMKRRPQSKVIHSTSRMLKQERDRLMVQNSLGGLPTQVNLLPAPNSNNQSEDEGSNQDDSRKRGSDSDTGDEMPTQKRPRDGEEVEGVVGGITKLVEFCSKDINSQLSQSQVQVKLEPPEDGPIIALNGDSETIDEHHEHYDSTGMNGDSYMETGAPTLISECRMRSNYNRRTMNGGQVELAAIAQ